jgi:hypothetical protein
MSSDRAGSVASGDRSLACGESSSTTGNSRTASLRMSVVVGHDALSGTWIRAAKASASGRPSSQLPTKCESGHQPSVSVVTDHVSIAPSLGCPGQNQPYRRFAGMEGARVSFSERRRLAQVELLRPVQPAEIRSSLPVAERPQLRPRRGGFRIPIQNCVNQILDHE